MLSLLTLKRALDRVVFGLLGTKLFIDLADFLRSTVGSDMEWKREDGAYLVQLDRYLRERQLLLILIRCPLEVVDVVSCAH